MSTLREQLLWLFGSDVSEPIAEAEAKGLTPSWKSVRLDKVGSVSALRALIEVDWDDLLLDEQYQRFRNGFDV